MGNAEGLSNPIEQFSLQARRASRILAIAYAVLSVFVIATALFAASSASAA